MCKNVVLIPLKSSVDPAMQKSCKPAMLGRMWQASSRAFSLDHWPSHRFGCCQWQKRQQPSKYYILYRWIIFIAVLAINIASFACQRIPVKYHGLKVELNYFKWFIYLTNWGFMLIAVQAALALGVVYYYKNDRNLNLTYDEDDVPVPMSRRKRTPILCRVYWLTQNVATDLAFVISLVYWALVYDPEIHEINAINLLVHGGNSAIMLCELAVTAHPIRMAHAMYGAGAGLAYGLFSAFYWAVGGTDRLGQAAIYPTLDWNKPAAAFGFVALCAVVLVMAHGVATCLAVVRLRLAKRLYAKRAQSDRLTLPTH
uniref:Protein rolling stone-like n=1 Tax=Bombyx mori TaxID=7091 RepID=A0A8R1WJL4_BOMMO|nr:protein rolling stone isoform X1 [Bombyx mori]